MNTSLPDEVPLQGADVALLAMSDGMRRRVGHDASCRLVVVAEGHVDPDGLGMRLKAGRVWSWLSALRLGRAVDGRPAWVRSDAEPTPMRLFFRQDEAALNAALVGADGHVGDPRDGTPVRVDLHHVGDGRSAITLTWHHALLDARGAELLLLAIAGDALDTVPCEQLLPTAPARDEGRWRRLMMARAARNHLLAIGLGSIRFPRRATLGEQRGAAVASDSSG